MESGTRKSSFRVLNIFVVPKQISVIGSNFFHIWKIMNYGKNEGKKRITLFKLRSIHGYDLPKTEFQVKYLRPITRLGSPHKKGRTNYCIKTKLYYTITVKKKKFYKSKLEDLKTSTTYFFHIKNLLDQGMLVTSQNVFQWF